MSYKYNSISPTESSNKDGGFSKTHDVVDVSYSRTSGNESDNSAPTSSSEHQALYSVSGLLTNISINFFTLVLSIAILAYAAVSWRANGNSVGNRELILLEISKYLTTAFPFVFGYIISQTLRDIFNLQLEKGIHLAPAAYLSKSGALGSVIGSIVSYRQFHWLPIVMLLVYTLSPLGSQATLRFVSIEPSLAPSIQVQYIYPDATNTMEEAAPGIWGNVAEALFLSSMVSVSSTGSKAQDTWGNIKIPFYESLDDSRKDDQGFVPVPTDSAEYASLIGIPVSHPIGNFNSTFAIQSWYWRFQDSNLTSPLPDIQPLQTGGVQLTNLTHNPIWSAYSPQEQIFQVAVGTSALNSSTLPIPLWFQDFNPIAGRDGVTNFSTTVTQTFVESKVSCNFTTCAVTAMRKVSPSRNNTINKNNAQGFTLWGMQNFVSVFPVAHSGTRDSQGIPEAYLGSQSDSNPFASQILSAGITLYTVGTKQIAQRLNVLINTYWIGSNALSTAAGAFNTSFENLASLDLNNNLMNTTAAVYVDSFRCSMAWFSILVLATLIMVISSLVSIGVNRMRTGTNDFTDFIWVLTRGEFYPRDLNSYLDVRGTLKALPRTKVQVGDVRPNEPYGKAVITEQGESLGKLTRDRVFS